LITEDTLARALAKTVGREYAYWSTVQSTPREIIALLPARLAIRCQAVPFSREGRTLKLAMRDPNDLAAADELAFVTGRNIEPFAIAEFRLAEALERFYGERRPPRLRALAERLARGTAAVAPAAVVPPPPPPSPYQAVSEEQASAPAPAAPERPSIWKSPPSLPLDEIEIESWRPAGATPPTPEVLAIEYTPEDRPLEAASSRKAPESAPITFEEAAVRMLAAETRDDIAQAVLDHLRQSFQTVALFISRKDDVIGWDAVGAGVSRPAIRSIRIGLSQPSVFLNARLSGGFFQGRLPELPAHEPLLGALGRRPEQCALLPVSIKNRIVAILLVEPRGAAVPPAQVEDLKKIGGVMGDAFSRLVLKIKQERESA
jgi:hypothetical protein